MPSARLPAVDALRGVALLGILVMNVQSFALPHAAYLVPTAWGRMEGLDLAAWALGRLLFDYKFLGLFSLLFGASLVLGGDATRPRRRLAWLAVLGLLHAYLVWYGDVLLTYAVVGALVLGARDWPVRRLLVGGVVLLLASPAILAGLWASWDVLPAGVRGEITSLLAPAGVAAEVAAFRGPWAGQFSVRAAIAFEIQSTGLLTESGYRAAGCMLVGMAAVRARVFEGAIPVWPVVPAAVALGLLLTGLGMAVQWTTGFAPRPWLLAQALHLLGAVPLTAAIGLGGVALATRLPESWPVRAAARLGRVALTAYLAQSAAGTLVFGGQGLGLFGEVGRAALLAGAVGFWALQVGIAWAWTSRYRTGPMEALWRGLARGEFGLGREGRRAPAP